MLVLVVVVVGLAAAAAWFLLRARGGAPVNRAEKPADAGRALRLMALTTPAAKIGLRPDEDYPKVYGVLVDLNIEEHTASILALRDGTASLYTTSTFGILGGQGHASVRKAAEAAVRVAAQSYDKGAPTTDFPYPGKGKVHLFVLGYEGVRLCVADEAALAAGTDPMLPVFDAAQGVMTELRSTTEPGK